MEIRVVTDAQELHAVARQRYAIHIEELGYTHRYADRATRTVIEPLDASGVLFAAFDGTRLAAAVRVNYGLDVDAGAGAGDGGFGEFAALFGLRRFGAAWPRSLCITTRLMIDSAYRSSTLMARLAVALYAHTCRWRPQIRFSVIDCVPRHQDYFERLGYRAIGPRLLDPVAGPTVPMGLAVYDREHFERLRSPFAASCPRHDAADARWFDATFAAAAVEETTP